MLGAANDGATTGPGLLVLDLAAPHVKHFRLGVPQCLPAPRACVGPVVNRTQPSVPFSSLQRQCLAAITSPGRGALAQAGHRIAFAVVGTIPTSAAGLRGPVNSSGDHTVRCKREPFIGRDHTKATPGWVEGERLAVAPATDGRHRVLAASILSRHPAPKLKCKARRLALIHSRKVSKLMHSRAVGGFWRPSCAQLRFLQPTAQHHNHVIETMRSE